VETKTYLQQVKRPRKITLGDLLDRLLEKGLFLQGDIIITVSEIPLLGVNLKLSLAGMSTMLRYGVMTDWDEAGAFGGSEPEEE